MLSKYAVFRDETDYTLLYHYKNRALLKISHAKKKWLQELSSLDNLSLEDQPFIDILKQAGFINTFTDKKSDIPIDDPGFSKFLQLKSDIAPLNLLWEITAKCNLQCLYCFPEVNMKRKVYSDLSLDSLCHIADQIIDCQVLDVRITGGEALLHNGIWDIIDKLINAKITVTLLTNGTMINSTIAQQIKDRDIPVATSIDCHKEEINRITRGKDVLKQTLQGIEKIMELGIPVNTITTLTKYNYPYIEDTLKFINNLGIKSTVIQDLRYFGNNKIYDNVRLNYEQEKDLIDTINKWKNAVPDLNIVDTELSIYCHYKKDKQNGYRKIMECRAGDQSGYIDFKGNFHACTSLTDFPAGNLLENNLKDIWQHSDNLKYIRNLKSKKMNELQSCAQCDYISVCDGGCRGDAFKYTGDILGTPSRCHRTFVEKNCNVE